MKGFILSLFFISSIASAQNRNPVESDFIVTGKAKLGDASVNIIIGSTTIVHPDGTSVNCYFKTTERSIISYLNGTEIGVTTHFVEKEVQGRPNPPECKKLAINTKYSSLYDRTTVSRLLFDSAKGYADNLDGSFPQICTKKFGLVFKKHNLHTTCWLINDKNQLVKIKFVSTFNKINPWLAAIQKERTIASFGGQKYDVVEGPKFYKAKNWQTKFAFDHNNYQDHR